jgi:hypothetical protein
MWSRLHSDADASFTARLNSLIDAGRIEADGPLRI